MTSVERLGLWSVCAIGFAFSANYTNHAPLAPALAAEFGFNLAAAGLLTTGIFLTHAGMQIPGGYLADRFGSRRVLAVALAIVCLGNAAIGFATGYSQLLFWKIFVGLGTGASFVAGARYIATLFAGPRLHLAQGLYGGSILMGSGFVIFAVPLLFAAIGWQGAFFSTAALAAAAWLVWMFLTPAPPALAHKPAPLAGMLSNPQLWLLGIVQMASFGLVIVVGVWVTTYLSRSFHIPMSAAGRIGSLVLLMGIGTRPLGGALVPRWGARRTMQVSLALSIAACLAFGLGGESLARASAGVLLLGLGCGLPYAAVFNRAAALYPGRAGAAMGLVNMLGIVMILAAPPLIGQMVEWSGTFRSSFLALAAFTAAAWTATLAIHEHESDRPV
ncbi:MAG TPA: MFS transporter [Bryobacteraceae bacterium]|jgi:nitrate/nitrite transporter NarK|nr:MFS transporter [Bryobacteraceae bacterium]